MFFPKKKVRQGRDDGRFASAEEPPDPVCGENGELPRSCCDAATGSKPNERVDVEEADAGDASPLFKGDLGDYQRKAHCA